MKNIPQLRWYLYSKFQCESDKLPPTVPALKFKIFRSHFVTLVLRRSLLPLQRLPSPLSYGWELSNSDECIIATMTDELPAPLALNELSVCGCKSKCSTNRCKCYKNHLACTDMCKCCDCENNTEEHSADEIDNYSYDDDEYDI